MSNNFSPTEKKECDDAMKQIIDHKTCFGGS
jgi:hypothetical protein